MMSHINRNKIAAAHDSVMAAVSFVLALYLRLGGEQMALAKPYLLPGTAAFALIACLIFAWMRLYRGLWRFASMQDMVTIAKASALAVLLFFPLLFIMTRMEGVPRSLPFIHWLLLMAMLAGPRFLYRTLKDGSFSFDLNLVAQGKVPVLLAGATQGAELFIQECRRNPFSPYEPVAVMDDDPHHAGRSMYGLKIHGGIGLPLIVAKLARTGKRPQRLVLCDETASGEAVRRLFDAAEGLGLTLARLPKLSDFRSGEAEKPDIRPVALEDLLGRPQQVLDRTAMQRFVAGKRVLVTGAGGTIGSELVRQIAGYGPSGLSLLELSEYALYLIDQELGGLAPHIPRTALLGDVRDEARVHAVFTGQQPEIVFHAAAIKHVPLAEDNPEETILTNAVGTRVVADACLRHHVSAMVLISTDKAVNPTSVMGASKRIAEGYCQAQEGGPTQFITVRFGNVLGSTGSVVPLFERQLRAGGPLTVTHKDMTRFFMTVREAVELVLQAAALGAEASDRKSAIFVLDMGAPVRIEDLAVQMIRLAGLRPHEDIRIVYTGLRPGEKMHEELFHSSENAAKTAHAGILRAQARPIERAALERGLNCLLEACRTGRRGEALRLLKELLPEFTHPSVTPHDTENHPRAALRS